MQKQDNSYYINGIANGDNKVLLDIYDEFLPYVKKYVFRENGTIHDAEDVFNQVLVQFFTRLRTQRIELRSTFESYLLTACKNIWRRELNKKKREWVTNDGYVEHISEATNFAQAIMEQEMWELYEEKFKELSENCSRVLKLHLEKVPGKIIMGKLGYASESTVRQRIFKCKSSLIKAIQSDKRYRT